MLWQKSIINLSIPWYRLNFPTTTFRVLKIFSRYLLGSISLATNKYYCFQSKAKMFMTWFLQFHLRKLISYSHVTGNSKKKEWMKLIIGIFNQFFWLTWSEKFFLLKKMNQYKCVKTIMSLWMKIMEELYPNAQRFWKMLKISFSITVFSTPMPSFRH